MATKPEEHDLAPEQTEGFKVGQKKTMQELGQLDQGDDSLNRWKQSLGLGAGGSSTAHPSVAIHELAIEVTGRPDVVMDLTKDASGKSASGKSVKVKEGAKYRMRVKFVVSGDICSGLKYVQSIKRYGVTVAKNQEMIGSYPPNTQAEPVHTMKFAPDEFPSGMTARGTYKIACRFIDDDNVEHLKLDWTVEVAKKWEDEK